jgi:hypothetical protein
MASKATTNTKPKQEKTVKAADFDALKKDVGTLTQSVGDLVALMTAQAQAPAAAPIAVESAIEKEVRKAAPDINPVNPAWIEKAEEILGEALDHCEVFFPKRGGTIFTLVIQEKFSNASAEYMERTKTDRRSKEIGNEGIEGVEQWCKLVAANLKRPKPVRATAD